MGVDHGKEKKMRLDTDSWWDKGSNDFYFDLM
jgi:hypothetical protein